MGFIKFLLLIPLFSFASVEKLPELKTKQPIEYIRYLSQDGKITYYQKRSGEFLLTTNYDFSKLLKYPDDTMFYTNVSKSKQKIIIEVSPKQHRQLNSFKLNDLYLADYGGGATPTKFTQGKNGQLHLKDSWVSSYNPVTKEISIHQVSNLKSKRVIKIQSGLNPFFVPSVGMITANDVVYTDINEKGENAILHYSFIDKSFKTIFKSQKPGKKVEFCLYKDSIVVGDFPYSSVKARSSIYSINLYQNKNYSKKSLIYDSGLPDIGNFICQKDKIFFIKTKEFLSHSNIRLTDAALLNLKDSSIKFKSNLDYVTQLIRMDNLVLIAFAEKYYIVDGKQNLLKAEIKTEDKI